MHVVHRMVNRACCDLVGKEDSKLQHPSAPLALLNCSPSLITSHSNLSQWQVTRQSDR